jgi:hypothetical protein
LLVAILGLWDDERAGGPGLDPRGVLDRLLGHAP